MIPRVNAPLSTKMISFIVLCIVLCLIAESCLITKLGERSYVLPFKDEPLEHMAFGLTTDDRQKVYNPSIHGDGSISMRVSTYNYCRSGASWDDPTMFPLVRDRPDLQKCCRITESGDTTCIPDSEDMRLFTFNNETMGIFTRNTFQRNEKECALVMCSFSPVHEVRLRWNEQRSVEKNWVPFEFEGTLYFSYSLGPHVVLRHNGDGVCEKVFETRSQCRGVRGGTPWIKVKSGFLCVAHKTIEKRGTTTIGSIFTVSCS